MQGSDLWKGMAAGLAAGLVATYAMTKFQKLTARLGEVSPRDDPRDPQHSAHRGTAESARQGGEQEDDATVKGASAISEGLFHHELTQREKEVAGPAMHYGFGGLTGGLYGFLAELSPAVTWGAGLPFGTAVWLGADELAVPAFGLAGPPWEHPPMVHGRALAAHLVYGLTAEMVRRQVRRLF
ncbi:MAG TPA: DUF1440 domain-containing protein [Thermoanaerobaculia bacterium]|jgi:hypothetical protein|nr:DUF1440 domain-containing protein [Thermoanaerobaculia bacterium]